jgi:flagellar protein FliJ
MREQVTQVHSPNSWVCSRIAQIESLILELGRKRRQLCRDIEVEETRVGISDPHHYAYPPLAKALRERGDRLERSIESLIKSLEEL